MSRNPSRITLIGPDGPILSRRLFLRGSLIGAALGAGALPTPADAQYGSGGATPGAGAGSRSGPAPGSTGRGKESKAVARYQDSPNGNQRCGRCTHFRKPNGCEIVNGSISPNGWCRHFKPAA
jgi:hypothetical protein